MNLVGRAQVLTDRQRGQSIEIINGYTFIHTFPRHGTKHNIGQTRCWCEPDVEDQGHSTLITHHSDH